MSRRLFSLIILFALYSCSRKEGKIKPSTEAITESVYASGIIKSKNQYQVFSTANGLIENIYVREGDSVKKGTVILAVRNEATKLNTENAKLAASFNAEDANSQKLKELKVNIDALRLKMNDDSLLMERQKSLWKASVGTRLELEQRILVYENSKAAYEASLLRYKDLEKQIRFAAEQSKNNLGISQTIENDFIIKSKIDGIVYSLLKEPGEMVNTQTPVAIIGDANSFIMELQIDEYDIVKVKVGKKVFVRLDSYKGEAYEGIVTEIVPIMNERSKTFTIEAQFIKSPPILYPNLTLEASILIDSREKALTIPRNYLIQDEYVLKSNGDKVKVVVGLKDYQKAEILSGISASDELKNPAE